MRHEDFMREALAEAQKAYDRDEVPIGAVLVMDDTIVARAHNLKETLHNATAHAEILLIQQASQQLFRWRLSGATVYVTLEPCPMCAGALVQARIDRLVFGAWDPKAGAAGSLLNIVDSPLFNHRLSVIGGILEEECSEILRRFFRGRRHKGDHPRRDG